MTSGLNPVVANAPVRTLVPGEEAEQEQRTAQIAGRRERKTLAGHFLLVLCWVVAVVAVSVYLAHSR